MPAFTVRNSVYNVMLPIRMAGTEFITVPFLYTTSRVFPNLTPEHVDTMNGDIIRILAVHGNMAVWRRRAS